MKGLGIMITQSNRLLRGAACVSLLVAVAACNEGSVPNPTMSSAHVPVVHQMLLVHDLGRSQGALSREQLQSLTEWLDSIGIGYGDRISLDDRYPGAGVRRAAVAEVLSHYGLLLADNAPATAGGDGVRLVVLRSKATLSECPDWSRESNAEFDASTMSNYGCATASNLAAMVADANDLVSGKPHVGTDAETTVTAIKSYRSKAGKATQTVKNTVGEVSSNSGN